MARSVKSEAKPSPGGFAGSAGLSCFANLGENIALQQPLYHHFSDSFKFMGDLRSRHQYHVLGKSRLI